MKMLLLALALFMVTASPAKAAQGQQILVEDFSRLDKAIAESKSEVIEEMPEFADGYKKQKGKLDATGKQLMAHLKKELPYPFKSLAGEGMVDVVTLKNSGHKAYAFIILKTEANFMKNLAPGKFYYDLGAVIKTLDNFILAHPEMDKVIFADKGSGYFIFTLRKKK